MSIAPSQTRSALWNGLWVVIVWVTTKWPLGHVWAGASSELHVMLPQSYYDMERCFWVATSPIWVLGLTGWPQAARWRGVIRRLVVLVVAQWLIAVLMQAMGMWWGFSLGFALLLIAVGIHLGVAADRAK